MKKILVLMVCAVALSACGSHYMVTTESGQEIKTQGKPKLDEDTGMYRYKDIDGHDVLIKQDEVMQIKEL
ncbi:YgdI/YgdR family lipoprotein [Thiococcus pfennigii]|uniref:YgdI/YgdR family lipoprotein n=1 Tax=Thiococcus pfennigii TaxID=1057 RepID=UPI0019069E5D|nr:YgdI/YgdR family lipoprotein [Thiococcus pfennigii]MBK1700067.1 YgdI/YgdR family lipoprotein [Thiococcus pfennigii]MBK1732214.1 YgdI/YgdR family lipoprotein [Thiococcus pfennigii]